MKRKCLLWLMSAVMLSSICQPLRAAESVRTVQETLQVGTEAEDGLGLENLTMTFKTLDGQSVSSRAENGRPKILIFYSDTCGRSQAILSNIDSQEWLADAEVDVYAIESYFSGKSAVERFRDTYVPSGTMTMCYEDSNYGINKYAGLVQGNGAEAAGSGSIPFIIMIDSNNLIQYKTNGYEITMTDLKNYYIPRIQADPITGPALSVGPQVITFEEQESGYEYLPPARTVSIRNLGDEEINLEVVQEEDSAYTLSEVEPQSLQPQQVINVTVQPRAGLKPGVYQETILIRTDKNVDKEISLSFTVTGTEQPVESHAVTVTAEGQGTAYADPETAAAGEEVRLTAVPAEGYQFIGWEVTDGTVNLVDPAAAESSFIMPDTDVSVKAVFTRAEQPAADGLGLENLYLTFSHTLDGEAKTSQAENGKPKMLIFYNDNCSRCHGVLEDFDTAEWLSDGSIDVVTIEATFADRTNVERYHEEHLSSGKMAMCYNDQNYAINMYSGLIRGEGKEFDTAGSIPLIIMIDSNNLIQYATNGTVSKEEIAEKYLPGLMASPIQGEAISVGPEVIAYEEQEEGYEAAPGVRTVTVRNLGTEDITLIQPESQNYSISQISEPELAPGERITFTIQPKTGLEPGTYTESVQITTVSGVSKEVQLSFTVTEAETPEVETHSVTVTTEGNGTAQASLSEAEEGSEVVLTATAAEGWEFREWVVVSGEVEISENGSFRMPSGDVEVKAVFAQKTAAAPEFSVPAGTYQKAQKVALHSADPGTVIYYTTDGKDPAEAGIPYTEEISVSRKMTIRAVAVKEGWIHSETVSASYILDKVFPFTDVTQDGGWKYQSIKYMWDNGIMNGISNTTEFRGDQTLTRAMFATVLYRMAGEPEVTTGRNFTDVKKDTWYTDAVMWVSEKKIAEGFTDGSFGIDQEITRDQIAKMLYLYAELQGFSTKEKKELTAFTDADAVKNWAVEYMKWAVNGIISGKPNPDGTTYRMAPGEKATRAECAAMLMRFEEKYHVGE